MFNELYLEPSSDEFPRPGSLWPHRQDWLEKQLPYYKVLLVLWEVSILTLGWLRTILCWILCNEEYYNSFILTASQLVWVFSFVMSKFLFSYKMPDMKILFLAYLISTLRQMLIKFFHFSWIWESLWEPNRELLNFCFLTCTVCPLQSGASVQFQLLPQRENALRRVSQLTPLMGEGWRMFWTQLGCGSQNYLENKSFVQSRSALNVPN